MSGLSLRERLSLAGKSFLGIFSEGAATQAAHGLLAGIMPLGAYQGVKRGTRDLLGWYTTHPLFRMVVSRIGDRYASIDWSISGPASASSARRLGKWLYRAQTKAALSSGVLKGGGSELRRKMVAQGDLIEADAHPLLDMIYKPNPVMSGMEFRYLDCIYMDTIGESFWALSYQQVGRRSVPNGAWPIPPHWIWRLPVSTDPNYKVSYAGWQPDFPDNEMLFLRDVDPLTPYFRGVGLGRSLADELETDEAAAKHTRAFFFNRARPDLWVMIPGAKQDQLDAAEARWLDKLQGAFRAHLPYFTPMPVGTEVKELSQNFGSLGVETIRTMERDRVIQLYGMSPEALGINQGSNRATSEVADYMTDRNVVVPRLERRRQMLQGFAEAVYDPRTVVDFENPIRDDQERIVKVLTIAPWAQTVDEWAEMIGQEPIGGEDGKIRVLNRGQVPVRDLGKLADQLAAGAAKTGGLGTPTAPVTPAIPVAVPNSADALAAAQADTGGGAEAAAKAARQRTALARRRRRAGM